MAMTRRDFATIAAALRGEVTRSPMHWFVVKSVAIDLAIELGELYPNFDSARFFEAALGRGHQLISAHGVRFVIIDEEGNARAYA